MVYLDWAATSPPYAAVLDEMTACALKYYGNPSSLHEEGRLAAEKREEFRRRCAAVLACRPDELTLTSGGSESNNMVVTSLYQRRDRGRIIVSGLEHPAVWEPVQLLKKQGWEVKVLNPGPDGFIHPENLGKSISEDTKMLLVMGVHNESGAIQPLNELARVLRESSKRPIHFHSDLVQQLGKIPLNLNELDLDSASFSAHKIQGPRGVGLLYHRKPLGGLYTGGGQEQGLRPGTENLAALAGMTLAMENIPQTQEMLPAAVQRMDRLMEGIQKLPQARLLPEGRLENRDRFSPWILNCAFPPLPGEVLVRVLDEAGFAVSTGSACSSNKKSRTRGLEAMGIPHKTAFSSIRISQGCTSTMDEIEAFLDALGKAVSDLGQALWSSGSSSGSRMV